MAVRYLSFLVLLLFFTACSDDPENPTPEIEPEVLVDYSLKTEYDQNTLTGLAFLGGLSDFIGQIGTGIDIYTITYETTFQGNTVVASGVVSIPKSDVNGLPPLMGACRGTIFADSEAPSQASPFYGYEVVAAAGYVAILPDYIGFGSTRETVHPYYNEATSAQATIDAIKAGKELLQILNREHTDQLFLFGYSQGGYNAMATLKAIEESGTTGLNVSATAAGAGSYDIVFVMNEVLGMEAYTSPAFLAFLVYSFNEVNGWERPLTDFFQEPYVSKMPGIFDGTLNVSGINAELTEDLGALFNPDFLQGLMDGTETEVLDAFAANSVHDWAPASPVRLYHSTGDQYIPYAESESTQQLMQQNGAASVEFFQAGTGTHEQAVLDMVTLVVPWFESLRAQ